jgi:hypothetical protein
MTIAIFILFLIPLSIISVAWKDNLKSRQLSDNQVWRSYCARLGLVVAILATFAAMGFNLSWTHNGGSPHGMSPGPGLWITLRPIAKWLVVAAALLGMFGKGRMRLLIVGSAFSIFFVDVLLAILEMD